MPGATDHPRLAARLLPGSCQRLLADLMARQPLLDEDTAFELYSRRDREAARGLRRFGWLTAMRTKYQRRQLVYHLAPGSRAAWEAYHPLKRLNCVLEVLPGERT